MPGFSNVSVKPMLTPAARGVLWALFATFNFALMGVLTKESARLFAYQSNELATWRNLPAVFALGAYALLRRQRFSTQLLRAHVVRSVSGASASLIQFYTLTILPLATAVTLGYSSAIFIALFSFLLLRERITRRTIAVLVIGLSGVAILLRPGFNSGQAWGLSCGLVGAAATGLAHLQLREMSATGEPAWRIVFSRLARHRAARPAVSARHRRERPHRADCHHPRLRRRAEIHHCRDVLSHRGLFRPLWPFPLRRDAKLAGDCRHRRHHRRGDSQHQRASGGR